MRSLVSVFEVAILPVYAKMLYFSLSLLTDFKLFAKSFENICDERCISSYFHYICYSWHEVCCRYSSEGDKRYFESLPAQRSCSYKVRLEDIGRCLRCECIVTDVFGRSSEPAYAETALVMPGILFTGAVNWFKYC